MKYTIPLAEKLGQGVYCHIRLLIITDSLQFSFCVCLAYYFLRLSNAREPNPKRTIVTGSGTGLVKSTPSV